MSIGMENIPVIATEHVPVRRLPRVVSGAIGAGQRAGSDSRHEGPSPDPGDSASIRLARGWIVPKDRDRMPGRSGGRPGLSANAKRKEGGYADRRTPLSLHLGAPDPTDRWRLRSPPDRLGHRPPWEDIHPAITVLD